MKQLIYLDNSATTQIRSEVLQAMKPYQEESFGNGSSIHRLGRRSRAAIDHARESVAAMLNSDPSEIFFTPCATYSNNAALLGRARFVEESGLGRHIITSPLEHASAAGPIQHLASRGWRVTMLNVDEEGFIDIEHLKSSLTCETSIISVMWANNEIGTIQPIQEIADIASRRDIFFYSDAVQIAGKANIDLSATKVDCLSISGHKFHAPKGIGVLYVRKGVKLMPIVFGGGQEEGLSPGTENIANIIGLATAAELSIAEVTSQRARLDNMHRLIADRLLSLPGVSLTGPSDLRKRVPGHVSFCVDGAYGADLVEQADKRGVLISSASACSSKAVHPSAVLRAIGKEASAAQGSLRVTAGILNTEDECQRAAVVLSDIIAPHIEVPMMPSHTHTSIMIA